MYKQKRKKKEKKMIHKIDQRLKLSFLTDDVFGKKA